MSLVLVVDKGGMPKDWCNFEMAACYYAKNKVLWELGEKMKTMLGGHNERGEQSRIDISCIIGVSGPLLGDKFYNQQTIFADRMTLYSRDRHLCAYCGDVFSSSQLTIDHVHPKSRGGQRRENFWLRQFPNPHQVSKTRPQPPYRGSHSHRSAKSGYFPCQS